MKIKKTILLFSLIAVCGTQVYAQEYSTSVTLIDESESILTVESIGLSEKKKEAVEMAVKSAFYTLFYRGVSGYNNNKPLIQRNNPYYFDKFISTRYPMFVHSKFELGETAKLAQGKSYKAQVEVRILIKSLIKDLVFEKLMDNPLEEITMQDTKAEIGLPSVTVVPYKTADETYQDILQNDFDRRTAVSAVQEGFSRLGVTTVDFEGKLNAIYRSTDFNANAAYSDERNLLAHAGADVYVIVDIKKDISASEGSRISLNMKAYETASGNILASRQEWTNRFYTNDLAQLCAEAAKGQLKGFLDELAMGFARTIGEGNSIVLRITQGQHAKTNLNSQVGNYTLSNIIRRWVRQNAQDGRYHLQGVVAEEIVFDDVKIPAVDVDGLPMDAAQFGDNLLYYLNEEAKVACEMKLDGKSVYIILK